MFVSANFYCYYDSGNLNFCYILNGKLCLCITSVKHPTNNRFIEERVERMYKNIPYKTKRTSPNANEITNYIQVQLRMIRNKVDNTYDKVYAEVDEMGSNFIHTIRSISHANINKRSKRIGYLTE
jgi:hypothetical protein